jgi:tetratricopeptide (TPR) repeat protein
MKRSVVVVATVAALVAAGLLVWLQVGQEREFRRLVAAGEQALAEDQTFVAIEAFSGALALKKGSMLAYLKRGETYRRRGEHAKALRDLREAAALDPTAPQPIELLADVNSAMGRHERAAELYRQYLTLDEDTARVLYKLAVAEFRSGQPAQAIEPLRKAVTLDDRFAEAHYLLGMCLRAQNRDAEALDALGRAVQLNPTFIAAREELADLHAERGERRQGIEQLEAIAALEPSRPERLVNVGLTYARMGQPDAAIVTLGRAAERYPDTPAVYAALGRVWLDAALGANDPVAMGKALEALQPIAGRSDATSETLALYGRALLLSGDTAAAEQTLQQAVGRAPVDPLAYRYRADAARRLGHAESAADAAARYATLAGAL